MALPSTVVEAIADLVEARLVGRQREYLDTKAAAGYLACSPNRLHKLTSENRIPHRHEGDRLLFIRSELDEWLDSGEAAI